MREWRIYEFNVHGVPVTWRKQPMWVLDEKQRQLSALVEGEEWKLLINTDSLVVKLHMPSGNRQVWIPVEIQP